MVARPVAAEEEARAAAEQRAKEQEQEQATTTPAAAANARAQGHREAAAHQREATERARAEEEDHRDVIREMHAVHHGLRAQISALRADLHNGTDLDHAAAAGLVESFAQHVRRHRSPAHVRGQLYDNRR